MIVSEFTFGSDPELMIYDPVAKKHRSAIDIIPGTKDNKVDLGNGHYAFYDNVLAEVNIKSSKNKAEAIENFGDCFRLLSKLVGTKLKLLPQASQKYDLSECQHPDAFVFGCDPEFCVYNKNDMGAMERVVAPVCMPGNTFRSGGGHIHIGHEICLPWGEGDPEKVVKLLDVFVGITSVCIDHDPTSAARRKLYGGAGTHRIKFEYGLEYRSLSNFWVASPSLVGLIYDLVDFVIDFAVNDEKVVVDQEDVKLTINSGNVKKAMSILQSNKKYMPVELYDKVLEFTKPVKFDFYKEWKL